MARKYMSPRSTLLLWFFFGVWVGSVFVIPVSLALFLVYGIRTPLLLLLVYYSYRFFFPAKEWMTWRRLINLDDDPYVRSQAIVFEEGAKPPAPDSKCLIGVHPHGVLTLGWALLASSTPFFNSKMQWLVADSLFLLPFIQDLLLWNNTTPCHKSNMLRLMAQGHNIALLPGGFEEATLFKRGAYRVFIKNRQGFIKYALQYGYTIHPCFIFGEEWTFYAYQGLEPFRMWLNKFKLPGVIFVSRFGFLPEWDLDVTIVVGKPLALPLIASPSPDDVAVHHARYVDALVGLFEAYKAKYAHPDAQLEIF